MNIFTDSRNVDKEAFEKLSEFSKQHSYKVIRSNIDKPIFEAEDIAFCNTSAFSASAEYFKKNGVYTKLHPKYDRKEYKEFWDEEEKRRKEGITLPGKLIIKPDGSYDMQKVHITGEHYGYLNYAQIKRTTNDTKYSVNNGAEKIFKYSTHSTKKIEFPSFWDGDYNYFKAKQLARLLGLHLIVAKARRKGFSYKNGWCAANRADLYPFTTTLLAAFDSASLFPSGTMTMVDNYLQFISKHTDWTKRRLIDREDHIKFGYRRNDNTGAEYGYKSEVICVSFGPNRAGAARGKDSDEVYVEEGGKAVNLLEFVDSTLPTMEDGIYTTGQMVIFGTGGGKDNLWEGFEDIFFNTYLRKFMSFNNIWDDGANGSSCGFFFPQQKNLVGFIDKHGNSLQEEALVAHKKQLDAMKLETKDQMALDAWSMERATKPMEAFRRLSNNIMPIKELEDHLYALQRDYAYSKYGDEGVLKETEKGIEFVFNHIIRDTEPELYHPVITDFPLKPTTDPTGCYVEWFKPFTVGGKIPPGLYRVWNDPFAQDKNTQDIQLKDSLGSTYVYEMTNNFTPTKGDLLVAEYVGRPATMDEYNANLFRIAKRWNAKIFFENDRGDVKGYAQRYRLLDYLVEEPDILWSKELQSKKTGREYGFMMTDKRKAKAIIYLRDWLNQKIGVFPDGRVKKRLHTIKSIALIKELIKLGKGNFDRVSSLLIGQYDMKEQESLFLNYNQTEQEDSIFDRELF